MIINTLADLHCDTAYELFVRKESFYNNSLAISYKSTFGFDEYLQVMAIWSDKRLDDNQAYFKFFEILNYLRNDISKSCDTRIFDGKDIESKNIFFVSVEDARILSGDISRLDALYKEGVRLITPLWSGKTCIGGSFDTDIGLSKFGKNVIEQCCNLGIIPDISHASEKSSHDILDICKDKIPVIASHSNSQSIFSHPRNLNDELFAEIKHGKGLVGINLCREHLGMSEFHTDTTIILRHIEHFLSLGGEDTICFGCDFDGAIPPHNYESIESLPYLANEMLKIGYSETLIKKIFYLNAKKFILKNIKNKPNSKRKD